MKLVVKVGGAALEDKSTLQKCARAIVELSRDGHQVAAVHGGGSILTRTLQLLGKQSNFVNGLRVTDAETRDIALMVLAGAVNKGLVAAIGAAGLPAVGLCGGDGLSFRARKKNTNGCELGPASVVAIAIGLAEKRAVPAVDGFDVCEIRIGRNLPQCLGPYAYEGIVGGMDDQSRNRDPVDDISSSGPGIIIVGSGESAIVRSHAIIE